MKQAGADSWRFEASFSQYPHLALFVRDALRLEVDRVYGVPPPLARTVSDLSSRLDEDARRRAGTDWLQWWAAVVGLSGRGSGEVREGGSALREYASRLIAVVDPPHWTSLSNQPALRQAVVATYEDGFGFADQVRGSGEALAQPGLFPMRVVRDAAEAVAAAKGVPVGSLDASAEVVDVDGPWWVIARRGVLLCSRQAASSVDVATEALAAVFTSLV